MTNDNGVRAEPWILRGRPGHDQQSVLRAAMDVFNHYGYDATSMGTVAEFLGISRSALYHHVPSKGELLRLALNQALVALEEIILQPEATNGPADERLKFVVQQMVAVFADQLPAVTLLLRLRGNTAIEQAALSRRQAFEREVVELVSLARDEGLIREDIEPRVAARLLIGMVNSAVDWYEPRSPVTPGQGQLASEILRLGFRGVSSSTLRDSHNV
jgi:AcrR family transcriptional regulator